ncbi:hypothetical protein [Aquibium sp. ELW1220]|uniref:hypothetical protein n=1 Tax=Aquibium sp. ELW1220 TaxID=2976766 RepID=UPI0025AF5434|nr:hypothetical protein [Aquibium sp. ELW1220]MDN2581399.1 hypothetical protein [Aquibium sp. ELW1220]
MASIVVAPGGYGVIPSRIVAGDTIGFRSGTYDVPLVIEGAAGTQRQPVIIGPGGGKRRGPSIFTSGLEMDAVRLWANSLADRRQRAGCYPSVGQVGDFAMLTLRNCRYVAIHGLDFDGCWPTAIYLDNCQHVVIHDVRFRGGTIAIGANGIDTHDVIVQHCDWQQDTSEGHDMWHRIPWARIHGASDNEKNAAVDLASDWRCFDGDFFRAWNVSGNLIIRRNRVSDAFNAIHVFNSHDTLAPGVAPDGLTFNGGRQASANVLIEDNDFVRIRDNVFEPESHAWNWVIRRNRLRDCFRPFSFELDRAGWFYVYENTGAFTSRPSTDLSPADAKRFEPRMNPTLFKLGGAQRNEGPIHVVNNSWFMGVGKGVFASGALGRLIHANNVVQFGPKAKAGMFGPDGPASSPASSSDAAAEATRFTRRWSELGIRMFADVSNDPSFPDGYGRVGYPLGGDTVHATSLFVAPDAAVPNFAAASPALIGTAVEVPIALPDGRTKPLEGGRHRGAVQTRGQLSCLDCLLGFLPDDSWLPPLPAPRGLAGPNGAA